MTLFANQGQVFIYGGLLTMIGVSPEDSPDLQGRLRRVVADQEGKISEGG